MQAELQHDAQTYGEYYAAVDLGSNSFHMVIVHVVNGSVQIIGKIKQKVRLAAGLDDELALDDVSMRTKEKEIKDEKTETKVNKEK